MATTKDAAAEKPGEERCANCDEPATVSTDGVSANKVAFCARHAPAGLE